MNAAQKLTDYLWMHQRTPFEYGVHDCATFVAKWVDRELGTDYRHRIEEFIAKRGLPRTLRYLKNAGAYREFVTEVTSRQPSGLMVWQPGDVCVFSQHDRTETLGIMSSRLIHAPAPNGLISFDSTRLLHHWSLQCLRQ